MDGLKELTSAERRTALTFADEIAVLAVRSPDQVTKSELYKVVNSVRRRFGFSEQEKLEEILRAIELGAATLLPLNAFVPRYLQGKIIFAERAFE